MHQTTLSPTEIQALLAAASSLFLALIFLVLAFWKWIFGRVESVDKNVQAILVNQAANSEVISGLKDADERLNDRIDRVEDRADKLDGRVGEVEQKLAAFRSR